ncbi:HAD family phosphatase [Ramlibacter sp. GTP1]|uniref:HAD family phosphatase n=2 Tax=Ramlibacter albus TaxID=2079448 RepID=A0A923S8G4_9BURK|nr:HAD family phosphatase [Ramlibacter albus]
MDGTLVDSMPTHARSWEAFTRRHGIDMSVAEVLARTTGRNGVECIRELMGADTPEARALELIAEKEAIYRDLFASQFREVRGVSDFIRAARERGIRCGIATAGDRHNIAFTLGHLKLAQAPDAIVGGDEGLPGKPDPALFLEAARRMGAQASQCIVFEDAPFGIEAARRAGMRAVSICTTHTAAELGGAHVIAQAPDFLDLANKNFLETLHA